MQQIVITTPLCKPPLTSLDEAAVFLAKADKLHHKIAYLLQTSPAEERLILLNLDEILSNAVVGTLGRTPSWK
ncbi:MAG TPA: hypothetical protein VGV39_30675 [Mesorhizobium sp.]|jgi:hypothetical protein|uniref:hypothetical protein n=1 Tax=Mesorhizobium sp. TaxID=1871066 RepID=UPI002DDD4880|nr:hypothetical protein [Mesorhizobium sp.]HEV2507474.1 hypothetical protein [Mesorhizobium sp.]